MSLYRHPLAGLKSQIATKRGLLEGHERRLPLLLRAMLPGQLGNKLTELRKSVLEEPPESLEALSETDAALDQLLAAHDEAARIVPTLRDCPLDVPDPPKSAHVPPWPPEDAPQLGFRMTLTRRVTDLMPDAWLVRWDDAMYLSRLRIAGAPVVLTSKIELIPAQLTTFKSTIRTSVPRGTPALEVRRERLFDGIGRAIGVVHDDKTGEGDFDKGFIVDAAPGAVALLSRDVRDALMALGPLKPRLAVRRGVVELAWGGLYDARGESLMPDAAPAVVLGIRAAIERA